MDVHFTILITIQYVCTSWRDNFKSAFFSASLNSWSTGISFLLLLSTAATACSRSVKGYEKYQIDEFKQETDRHNCTDIQIDK